MLWMLLFVVACSDTAIKGDVDDTSPPPPDDTGDTGDLDLAVPAWFTIEGAAGLDTGASTLVAVEAGDTTILPLVTVIFTDDEGTTTCKVHMQIDDPEAVPLELWEWEDIMPSTGPEDMRHLGFMVPDDATMTEEGCEDFDFGALGSASDVVSSYSWGMGFGGLRSDVEQEVLGGAGGDASDYLDADQLHGGSWSSDLFSPTTWASHVAVGSPAPDGVIATDGSGTPTDFYEQADLDANDGLPPPGLWQLSPVWLWRVDSWMGSP